MQNSRAPRLALKQAAAQILIPRRTFKQPFEQGLQIEAGSAADDRELAALRNVGKNTLRLTSKFACAENLIGFERVQQMVRDAAPFGGCDLCGADIHMPVNLKGIAVYDFPLEGFGEMDGQSALAGTRGTHDGGE
jgi:hypothetical protein